MTVNVPKSTSAGSRLPAGLERWENMEIPTIANQRRNSRSSIAQRRRRARSDAPESPGLHDPVTS